MTQSPLDLTVLMDHGLSCQIPVIANQLPGMPLALRARHDARCVIALRVKPPCVSFSDYEQPTAILFAILRCLLNAGKFG